MINLPIIVADVDTAPAGEERQGSLVPSQDGSHGDQPAPSPPDTGQTHNNTDSPRPRPSKPKGPPPPLPKMSPSQPPKAPPKPPPKTPVKPPKVSMSAVFDDPQPDTEATPVRFDGLQPDSSTEVTPVRKTPPPLPRTPPRSSVKQPPSRQGSGDSLETRTENNISPVKMNGTSGEMNNNTEDSDKIISQADVQKRSPVKEAVDVLIRPTLTGSRENVNKPASPKLPMKPKPRSVLNKSNISSKGESNSTSTSLDIDLSDETSPEKSSSPLYRRKTAATAPVSESKSNSASIQFLNGSGSTERLVQFRKTSSPSASPPVARKPLPKPHPKPPNRPAPTPSGLALNGDVSSSRDHSVVQQDSRLSNTSGMVHKDITNSGINSEKNQGQSVSNVSPSLHKKPLLPVPLTRPKPKPRKSINRNSLDGDGLHSCSPVTPSTPDSPVCDSVSSNNETSPNSERVEPRGESSVVNREEQAADTVSSHHSEKIKLREGEDREDVEYRVIGCRVSRSPRSHVTELEASQPDDEVVLRKKESRELQFDIQDVPSVEELKSIFVDSDEEAGSQGDGDNGGLSKDFQFGDKFLNFSPEDAAAKNSKESEPEKQVKTQSSSDKDSFDDLLSDKSLLEPTSLLNEIEDILTRSYKHSSLMRSGSSPEKKSSPYLTFTDDGRFERSRSVDIGEGEPVRPPRPRKEQKKLRSVSQVGYDSYGSDTESLPDLSRTRRDSDTSNLSMTLGKAKPHPPKPKRHKLLRVQRSHSDVTAMKSIVEKMDTSDIHSPTRRRQTSDASNDLSPTRTPPSKSASPSKSTSLRKNRPSRKAPAPPGPHIKLTPASPSTNLNTVVPLQGPRKPAIIPGAVPLYHSIQDEEADSDHDHHDYQDIPDESEINTSHPIGQPTHRPKKLSSPPKLPPRNLSNSHSFETSSVSSLGPDLDSMMTTADGSVEDMSISSSCFDGNIHSPISRGHMLKTHTFPKTSSPFVKSGHRLTDSEAGLGRSLSSLSDSLEEHGRRPVSGCSIQSDSLSGSHGTAEQSSSSDSELDEEQKVSPLNNTDGMFKFFVLDGCFGHKNTRFICFFLCVFR